MKRTDKRTETTFGEGISCFYCHVKIPTTFSHLLPPRWSEELKGIQDTWEEECSETTSRLACQITLEKKHDGMIVFVPDAPPMEWC